MHPHYAWHDFARIWQTPGDGEAADETIGACILDLYHSATPIPFAHWGESFQPTVAPAMVLCPSENPFDDEATSLEVARMLGADHQEFDDLSLWWPPRGPE
jgi:hypothetical protein